MLKAIVQAKIAAWRSILPGLKRLWMVTCGESRLLYGAPVGAPGVCVGGVWVCGGSARTASLVQLSRLVFHCCRAS